jgi:UDP-GlcNAc3NAcA epimerase
LKKIIHIVGNRPQFIKLAVLYRELQSCDNLAQVIVHTGQHAGEDMSGIFFRELAIPRPDVSLEIQNNGGADGFIAAVSLRLQEYLKANDVHGLFVYGDTNSTLGAALAARRSGKKLFHFEAGIRTRDNSMPEEINRVLTDRIASTNYCCTEMNYQAMLGEGFGGNIDSRLVKSGDLMLDAFLKIPFAAANPVSETNYIACTIHRAGNILSPENLAGIIRALNQLHERVPVIMPLHPHTGKRITEQGHQVKFKVIAPLGYPEMKSFIRDAALVITDSGGAAREAFFSKKRSLVIMEKPFWPEIIAAGCALNVGSNPTTIIDGFERLSTLQPDFQTPIFGDGNASGIIAKDIVNTL